MRLTDLAQVLRSAGLTVIEAAGWTTRGKDLARVDAIVWHHTATGRNWTDQRVADLLRVGRPDLPGPLAQLGLDRSGRYWLIASGRANHNGYGTYGNQTIGIEAYNDGIGEPWPARQVDAYVRGAAALGRAYDVPVARQLGHLETDPRRKVDPKGLDMAEMRRRVAALGPAPLPQRPAPPAPTPAPTPSPTGALMALTDDEQNELLALTRETHMRMVQQQDRASRTLGLLTYVAEWVAGQRKHTWPQADARAKKLAP